ncbi:fic/DOC family protein [bacterium BMS3Bbin08]|nr:fic/DOC family protein [bacterium BMS3Bbin08]
MATEHGIPKLRIVEPSFDSPLTSVIIDLEKLRDNRLDSKTHPGIFFQIKHIFQLLESLGSARIEGNNTTIAELVEKEISGSRNDDEIIGDDEINEIRNAERAMDFIESRIKNNSKIDQAFILNLHKIVVENLAREGSRNPGELRFVDVGVGAHKPLPYTNVKKHFDELVDFINQKKQKKYDLLITAIAHHRFAWIHPFDNGNGRVVRLLTYAMLIKQGFNVKMGRIINPTAIFCINRDRYYEMLSQADRGRDSDILAWCEYVLKGLLEEIHKIDRLLDRDYLVQKILMPALDFCLDRENIMKREHAILKSSITTDNMELTASDLEKIIPGKLPSEKSRILRKLKQKKMLVPVKEKARKYIIHFKHSYLLRGVIESLTHEGFIDKEFSIKS